MLEINPCPAEYLGDFKEHFLKIVLFNQYLKGNAAYF